MPHPRAGALTTKWCWYLFLALSITVMLALVDCISKGIRGECFQGAETGPTVEFGLHEWSDRVTLFTNGVTIFFLDRLLGNPSLQWTLISCWEEQPLIQTQFVHASFTSVCLFCRASTVYLDKSSFSGNSQAWWKLLGTEWIMIVINCFLFYCLYSTFKKSYRSLEHLGAPCVFQSSLFCWLTQVTLMF